MKTMFKLLCESCGFSLPEAANYVGAKLDTAKSWSSGHVRAPESVIDKLVDLAVDIDVAARKKLLRIEQSCDGGSLPEEIPIRMAEDDAEARTLGWPCAGTHHAIIRALVQAAPDEIRRRLVINLKLEDGNRKPEV